MQIDNYDEALHGQIIDGWLKARGKNDVIPTLPAIGFIALDNGDAVAASFLRHVEGDYCLFDGLVTNPAMPPFKRHLGIEAVVKQLIVRAKELKLKKVLAYSLDEGTLKRSLHHGFKLLPHRLIVLDLEHGEIK